MSARQKLEGLAVANSKVFNEVNRIPIKPPYGRNAKGHLALLVFLTIALAMLKKTASQYTLLHFVYNSVWCVRSVKITFDFT